MKKILLTAGLLSLLMNACTNESILSGIPEKGGVHAQAGTTRLSFDVGLPTGDPVTYAEIQTPQEKQIREIDVYQFGEGSDGMLEAVYNNVSISPSGTGYKLNLYVSGTGKKQFVFVANNLSFGKGYVPSIENLTNGSISYADFLKKTTQAVSATAQLNGAPLLMTGKTDAIDIQAGTSTPDQRVELLRVMSRVDVRNYEPILTITRVRLERSASTTTVDGVQPDGAEFITLPEATLPDQATTDGPIEYERVPATSNEGAYDFYKHVFYPYPRTDVDAEERAPLIVVEGVLFKGDPDRETKVIYKKPLKIDGEANFLGFKRNTRYTLVIKRAIPGEMDANIVVDKWNEEEIDAPMVGVTAPRIQGMLRPWQFSPVDLSWNSNTSTFTVNKNERSYDLEVVSNSEWEILVDGQSEAPIDGNLTDWLSYRSEHDPSHPFQEDKTRNILKFIIQLNDTGNERSVRCILRSKADRNKLFVFTVIQKHTDTI